MEWLYVLAVVVLAAAALLYLRSRGNAPGPTVGSNRPEGDYVRGREDARMAGMSQENRDWEATSRQRSADRQGPGGPG